VKTDKSNERFMTASTLDGHRFASEYIMKSKFKDNNHDANKDEKLVDYVKRVLDGSTDNIPAANVPRIFRLAMELDPLSLIHGFQISLKGELTFVGLRSPRALTACIVGLNAQPVGVPGVRIDPIGTGAAGQAIFRKERIVAQTILAQFTIDIALLFGLSLGADAVANETEQAVETPAKICENRSRLLIALSVWKIAKFLQALSDSHSLRTECNLVLDKAFCSLKPIKLPASNGSSQKGKTVSEKLAEAKIPEFPFKRIVTEAPKKNRDQVADGSLQDLIAKARLPANRSPLTLEFGG
jgi:CRISPR-associated protein Csb1